METNQELATASRHVGNSYEKRDAQLKKINMNSIQELIQSTIPKSIINTTEEHKKFDDTFGTNPPSESQALQAINKIANLNISTKCFYGCGYNPSILPPVIQRNVLENPGWYTPYTPYQSQISQGRLESLFHYQSMIASLMSMHLSNCSLLDEATALAEGVMMISLIFKKKKSRVLIQTKKIFPHLVDVLKTRAEVLNIQLIEVQDIQQHLLELEKNGNKKELGTFSGVVTQNPSNMGEFKDLSSMTALAKKHSIGSVVATDLFASCLYKPPGEMGFDIAIGTAQRFGIPMGFGGPHAGFIVYGQKEDMKSHIRKIPGRLIGKSIGSRLFNGKDGSQVKDLYRLLLQTRETFIKQEKASSNICTAQALLANMSTFYAMYHGPLGLKNISVEINSKTKYFAWLCQKIGYQVVRPKSGVIFDTVVVNLKNMKLKHNLKNSADFCKMAASQQEGYLILRPIDQYHVGITMNESTKLKGDIQESLVSFFAKCVDYKVSEGLFDEYVPSEESISIERKSPFLTHPVFNTNHTEMDFQRFLHRLCSRDISLLNSMIPLGSCTLKLNAACQMLPLSWPQFTNVHPFSPKEHAKGYFQILQKLSEYLRVLTGFDAVSLQPNSGANGEFTGLLAILKYFKSIGQQQRDICIIPKSAHGTNPTSAALSGLKVVKIGSDQNGNTNMKELKAELQKYKDRVAVFMITYPSTHGVFEENIKEMCELIHQYGGQVYMDGANMNAQLGYTSPGKIGADVCHLNLHKTFCIPHGGGGPGMGPIGVKQHLAQFLPGHVFIEKKSMGNYGQMGEGAVSGAPYGSPLIQIISYMYLVLMGANGLRRATEGAILNANYMAQVLRDHYQIVYTGERGQTAHQFIVDFRDLREKSGVTAQDVAKRLMDFGFHAPTLNWPIANAIMIQPTESESKQEIDYYCQALIHIRKEIAQVEKLKTKKQRDEAIKKSPLKNAPHCEEEVTGSVWNHEYSREQAAFPLPWVRERGKFWPSTRIDNTYGDLHPVCGTHWND